MSKAKWWHKLPGVTHKPRVVDADRSEGVARDEAIYDVISFCPAIPRVSSFRSLTYSGAYAARCRCVVVPANDERVTCWGCGDSVRKTECVQVDDRYWLCRDCVDSD